MPEKGRPPRVGGIGATEGGGSSVRIGSFQLRDGVASGGLALGLDTNRIKNVRLLKGGFPEGSKRVVPVALGAPRAR